MYEVVGCRECGELWIREGDAETATCPRCGRRFTVARLRTLGSAESAEVAREIRSNLLAERAEYGGIVAGYTDIDDQQTIDDEQYLTELGIDSDDVAEAGDRITDTPPNRSDREIVLETIDEVDRPSRDRIADEVEAQGLSKDGVETVLDRLRQAGEVTFDGEEYRRV